MLHLKALSTLPLTLVLAALVAAGSPAFAGPKRTAKAAKSAKASKKAAAVYARSAKSVPLPRTRPAAIAARARDAGARPLDLQPARRTPAATRSASSAPTPALASAAATMPLAAAPTPATSSSDLSVVKEAIHLARRGRPSAATELQGTISDPLARKLVEWAILRSDNNDASFARYNAFIAANPTWPSVGMFRRRAEAMLWAEFDAGTVRAFFAKTAPLTAKGHFALARVLLAQGDRAGAQAHVRAAWTEPFSRDMESEAREIFEDLITRADDKARMDRRIYADDIDTASRLAQRLGGIEQAILKARKAVNDKAGNAKALLDAIPTSAHSDPGYMFSRIQWLRRNEHYEEAARLLLAAPWDLGGANDTDEWWIERRLIARKLIELDQLKAAYLVCRNADTPAKENYQVESEFMAGWIALRFLKDPHTATQHFARIPARSGST